ncbi:MAG: hypothetical protein ACI4LI_05150 [Candidatus Fimenecus sp.]
MQNTLEISYDALYYLAQMMQAEYMDYDYFKLVGDIETNYDLFVKQAAESLQSSGLLTEDFSGNLESDDNLRQVATPLFFGNAESSLDLILQGETVSHSLYKFHFYQNQVTRATFLDGKVRLEAWDSFEELYADILRNTVAGSEEALAAPIEPDKMDKIMILKCTNAGAPLPIVAFCVYNGGVYKMEGESLLAVAPETFRDEAIRILEMKGV